MHLNRILSYVTSAGLILVSEPYYNEAGYEKQKGSDQGHENSRMYNEMVLIKLVQSMSKQLAHPLPPWENEVKLHIHEHGPRYADLVYSIEKDSSRTDL
jgi:ubiquitin-conjugating enzyme E2 O